MIKKSAVYSPEEAETKAVKKDKKVFIVHGRDEALMNAVRKLLKNNGLEPIILSEMVSQGRTIFENLEAHTDVHAAIVLYTPDDVGMLSGEKILRPRPRMNVVLEHAYLVVKLGRSKVITVVDDTFDKKLNSSIELPTDVSGITYISIQNKNWRDKIIAELKANSFVDIR